MRTQCGVVTIIGHPAVSELPLRRGDGRGRVRLTVEGVPIVLGSGPVSVWLRGELLMFCGTCGPWVLADAGGKGGPYLFTLFDNVDAGGPLEVAIFRASRTGRLDGMQRVGLGWLDCGGRSSNYILRLAHDGEDPRIDLYKLENMDWRRLGALFFERERLGCYVFKKKDADFGDVLIWDAD